MRARVIGSAVLATGLSVAFALSSTTVSGQAGSASPAAAASSAPTAKPAARAAAVKRTAEGRPDLQGVWGYATVTPLERPEGLGDKAEFASEKEIADFEARNRRNVDNRTAKGTAGDVSGAYNDFWWDRGTRVAGRQTSLVIDPPNGRIPAQTAEAVKRAADRKAAIVPRTTDADNPEDRSLWERCVARTIPYLSGPYNNNIQIIQTKDHVVVVSEMIHEARVIPTDGRPHGKVRKWHGDSTGKWVGDTLVVETINFIDKVSFRGSNVNLKLTERFSRPDANTLIYEFTVEDPTTWVRPWTVRLPMTYNPEGIFEYACHEANYGLEGIMKGSRLQDKENAVAPRPPATAVPPARR
jgi:hypothetical protein